MIPFSPCFLWRRDAPLTKRVFSAVSHIYLDQHVGIPHALYVHAVAAAGGIEQYKRSHLKDLVNTFAPKFEGHLPKATKEMVGHIVKFAFHVGDYCPGEYEIARKYRSGGWNEKSYLRKLIKAANAEAVFSDD